MLDFQSTKKQNTNKKIPKNLHRFASPQKGLCILSPNRNKKSHNINMGSTIAVSMNARS
jgi:hypothetical protein